MIVTIVCAIVCAACVCTALPEVRCEMRPGVVAGFVSIQNLIANTTCIPEHICGDKGYHVVAAGLPYGRSWMTHIVYVGRKNDFRL